MENAVCHFVFYTGPRKGEAQVFTTARVSIGRAANCDFRLEAFQLEQVAPHHAELLLEDSLKYCLYDLGTKSGTYVNGERVHERCFLLSEDYLRFGLEGPEVIFRLGQPMPGKQPLPEIFPVTAELEFFSGSDAGRIFPINAATTSNIGRRADLEVPLDPRGDMIVSGNHCNIRFVNGHFVLTDTSRNGTYVNNELVDQPMEIIDGDVLMMGDGGPQARFHVDQARRHYPNHRPLSPVAGSASATAAATSSFKPAQTTPAAPANLASAKPFATGSPVVSHVESPHPPPADAELSPEAEEINMEAEAAEILQDESPAGHTDLQGSDLDLDEPSPAIKEQAELPLAAGTAAAASPVQANLEQRRENAGLDNDGIPALDKSGKSGLAAVPKAPKLVGTRSTMALPSRKVLIGAGIAAFVIICMVLLLSSGSKDERKSGPARGNYTEDIRKGTPLKNAAAAFEVQVPSGWNSLSQGNAISLESSDKDVAIDYVRDPRANLAHLKALLLKNGASEASTDNLKVDGKTLKVYRSSVENVRRLGLILTAGNAPVMVFMEATQDAVDTLAGDSLQRLLVDNVKVTGPMPGVAAAAPLPKPPVENTPPVAATPAPAKPQASTAAPDAATTPSAQAAATTSASAATPAKSDAPAKDTATTPTGPIIKSKALKLSVAAPVGWTGKSEEADEMLMLSDGAGLTVRIARDPGDLDADATFKAMEEENWKKKGVSNKPHYHAGEFVGKGQNLLLVLIPEKQKSTLLIYATSPKDFTEVQRYAIRDILVQLIPQ